MTADVLLPSHGEEWQKLRNDQLDCLEPHDTAMAGSGMSGMSGIGLSSRRSDELKRVVRRMMKRDPTKRPTAESLVDGSESKELASCVQDSLTTSKRAFVNLPAAVSCVPVRSAPGGAQLFPRRKSLPPSLPPRPNSQTRGDDMRVTNHTSATSAATSAATAISRRAGGAGCGAGGLGGLGCGLGGLGGDAGATSMDISPIVQGGSKHQTVISAASETAGISKASETAAAAAAAGTKGGPPLKPPHFGAKHAHMNVGISIGCDDNDGDELLVASAGQDTPGPRNLFDEFDEAEAEDEEQPQ